jgi:hypothetical protein
LVAVKDMRSGEQRQIERARVVEEVRRGLQDLQD